MRPMWQFLGPRLGMAAWNSKLRGSVAPAFTYRQWTKQRWFMVGFTLHDEHKFRFRGIGDEPPVGALRHRHWGRYIKNTCFVFVALEKSRRLAHCCTDIGSVSVRRRGEWLKHHLMFERAQAAENVFGMLVLGGLLWPMMHLSSSASCGVFIPLDE